MTARVRIESLGVHLPEARLTTSALLQKLRFKPRWDLERLTGIVERRQAAAGEGSFEMALSAAQRALKASRYAAADVDLLIVGSLGRFTHEQGFPLEPSMASRLRRALGLKNAHVCFDVMNACAGAFTAIDVATSLLLSGSARVALIACGELTTNVTDVAVRSMRHSFDKQLASLTIGDAGAAYVVDLADSGGDVGFHVLQLTTEARYHQLGVCGPARRGARGFQMHTDPRKLHRAGLAALERVGRMAFAECGWTVEETDWFINHQTSARVLLRAGKMIESAFGAEKGPQEKVVITADRFGNTSTTSHALALHEHISAGHIKSGQRLVFSVSGSGIVSGCACYVLDDLPERYRAANAARSDASTTEVRNA